MTGTAEDSTVQPLGFMLSQVAEVDLAALLPADSPRIHGEVSEHVRRLIDTGVEPPPIVVHRETMRVIDGMHRVRAAEVLGRSTIPARFFDGSAEDAFALAVELNAEHGLPLSSSDKTTAAARVMESHPGWSDRRIASLTRLSPRTVRAVRQRITDPDAAPAARIGRDGRARPMSTADQRRAAAAMLRDDPGVSLRAVARETGISVTTVKDVARRLDNGIDPVPAGSRSAEPASVSVPTPARARTKQAHSTAPSQSRQVTEQEFGALLDTLVRDPSMRANDVARSMLRLMRMHAPVADPTLSVAEQIPAHCVPAMARVAHTCASTWTQLGLDLERAAVAAG